MATSKSAMKSILTSEKSRIRNKSRRTALKSAEKKFRSLIESTEVDKAKEQLNVVFKYLDKAVKAGTIHKNKSSRKKSQLSSLLVKQA
jgi:small subunit ribosomal protein S20